MAPLRLALWGGGLAVLVWVAWERCGLQGCPSVDRLLTYQPGGAAVLLDRNGVPFAELPPVEREVVPLDSLPAHVGPAFVAVEDRRFYAHGGVDWRRVLGAVAADIRAGGFVQGFSTITMQLARNVFPDRLPGRERTIRRKLLEIRVAREIEARFSKKEILELYINHIYFGGGAYGITAAARYYFDVEPGRLTLAQAALLAGLVQSPARYDPRRAPVLANLRRSLVLTYMEEQGAVTSAAATRARLAPLGVARDPPRRVAGPAVAPYFVEAARRELENRYGDALYAQPLRIVTTLDLRAQRAAEEELIRQLLAIEAGEFGRFDGFAYDPAIRPDPGGTPYLQGGILVLEAATGDVLALIGGRDFTHSRFDRIRRGWRQAGSAFKPFVFAAALEDGFAPSQRISTDTLRLEMASGDDDRPAGAPAGDVTMRTALVLSENMSTIRLAQAVGIRKVAWLARRSGITSPIPTVPSMAIGTGSVRPLELIAAYAPFAGAGRAAAPRLVLRIERANGERVWAAERRRGREVLSAAAAYVLTDMLADAVDRGTGKPVRDAGFHGPAAGKTGTTDAWTDAWFVGYTPDLVAGVWIGFDRPRPIVAGAGGGHLAAPVWGRMMRRIYGNRPQPAAWPRPDGVIERSIDPASGLVLADGCEPASGAARVELFLRRAMPAVVCPRGEPARPGRLRRLWGWAGSSWDRFGGWITGLLDAEAASRPLHAPVGP